MTTDVALRTLFDWFFANGGTSRPTVLLSLPGVDTQIGDSLQSPSVSEVAAGVTRQVGTRASVRADFLYRAFQDFYTLRRDLSTGQVIDPVGRPQDLSIVDNSATPEREHTALSVQANVRASSTLQFAGNYTLSKSLGQLRRRDARGRSVHGEHRHLRQRRERHDRVPLLSRVQRSGVEPSGRGSRDRSTASRPRLGGVDDPVPGRLGTLSLSGIHAISSGLPYGAAGLVSVASVTNPGYANPATSAAYFFTNRDAFRTEVVNRTDFSANYAYRFTGAGSAELFFQVQVWNVFNRQDVFDTNAISLTTQTRAGGTSDLVAFNPFTETPVEGVHWRTAPRITRADGTFTPGFGDPRNRFAYQTPRTLRLSMGVRF